MEEDIFLLAQIPKKDRNRETVEKNLADLINLLKERDNWYLGPRDDSRCPCSCHIP